jgi:hypothetical protein
MVALVDAWLPWPVWTKWLVHEASDAMLETYWLVAEGAAVAVPAAATAAYALQGRRRLQALLREPLFWDAAQPVSLATIFAELNGESDFVGSLRELVGGSGPLSVSDLERAVRLLQSSASTCRDFVLDQATEAVLRAAMPSANAPSEGIELMARLSEAYGALGFFRLMGSLNQERKADLPALLPVEGVQVGGLPLQGGPRAVDEADGAGAGVLGVLRAIGLGEGRAWLPTVFKAVEDLVRERQVKKARDAYFKTLQALGAVAADALRRRSPAGQQVRRNVYSPLDAYRTLQARVRARRRTSSGVKQWLVPAVEDALWDEYGQSLERAIALVQDKCQSLERVLMGKDGLPLAGEVLFRHRQGLLAGVAEDAFPVAPAEAAFEEYQRAKQQTRQESQ